MLVTLLLLLPLVGAEWNKECNSCLLDQEHTDSDMIQWWGFPSAKGVGVSRHINAEQAVKNGLTLFAGEVCKTPCRPYWAFSVHGCVTEAEPTVYRECALYNKDQYGRECQTVTKGRRDGGTYCYVKHGNKYWLHNGGSWGYTHYPVCRYENKICRFASATMIWEMD